jgi:uncharacterized repeat protein (TIGR03806 family)
MRVPSGFCRVGSLLPLLLVASCARDSKSKVADASVETPGSFKSDSCVVPPRPSSRIQLVPAFSGLTVNAPVALVQAPRQAGEPSGRWFIVDQGGRLHSFFEQADGSISNLRTTDMTEQVITREERLDERGLLAVALHPAFPQDPRAFVAYTASSDNQGTRFSSFVVRDGQLDLTSEVVLLHVVEPFSNHNGANVVFGPDGYLYVSLGDGGSHDDPQGNGQNTATLLGSILRIDVDKPSADAAYSIPSDNPFVDGGGAKEIYAYGLRNTWRFSFDRETGELWAGDVGQDHWEEISIIERGGNYGWATREAFVCHPPDVSECQSEGLSPPVYAYEHPGDENRSVTGGFVYRGAAMPELVGKYVFGDYSSGEIWQLERTDEAPQVDLLLRSGINISGFAEDRTGELYVLDYGGARVLKVVRGENAGNTLPATLLDTGCFDPKDPSVITDTAIPYEVALPFWSDGVDKQRFLVLPQGESLGELEGGDLELPVGGLTIKNFRHDGRLFETRFFVRHADGEYSGYSYAWRRDGSDADLVETTRVEKVADLDWVFPGLEACNQCHTAAAGRSLGLELRQLAVSQEGAPQLEELRELGALDGGVNTVAFPGPDSDATLEERARAYLHVNCSSCHRPAGPARGALDLRYDTALADTGLCEPAQLGNLETLDGLVLSPGDAEQSVLYARLSTRGEAGMPPLASNVVDLRGADLIKEWIESLDSCP